MKIVNIVFALSIITVTIIYCNVGLLWIKGTDSMLFVLMALVNFIHNTKIKSKYKVFSLFLTLGLGVAAVADVVLNITFIPGAIIFAICHILYVIAFYSVEKFKKRDLTYISGIIAASVIITLLPIFDYGSTVMFVLVVAYAVIISVMLGKSASNATVRMSCPFTIMFIGSALFYFSDLMLLINIFGNGADFTNTLCVITYYVGQCLLAYSVYCVSERTEE